MTLAAEQQTFSQKVACIVDLVDEVKMSCLSYWYPKITEAGLPTPDTVIIKCPNANELASILDGSTPSVLAELCHEIQDAAGMIAGCPFFLRTGQTSGKHMWDRTCYVADITSKTIMSHIAALIDFSGSVDMIGLPIDIWVVRKLLDVTPLFRCELYRGMPIVPEARCFVDGGKLVDFVPYWPEGAIEEGQPDNPRWKEIVAVADDKIATNKSEIAELACRAGMAVGGQWSVDVLLANDGLFVTDMAVAERSYGYDAAKFEATAQS